MCEIGLPPIWSLKKGKAKRSGVLTQVLVTIQVFLVVALWCFKTSCNIRLTQCRLEFSSRLQTFQWIGKEKGVTNGKGGETAGASPVLRHKFYEKLAQHCTVLQLLQDNYWQVYEPQVKWLKNRLCAFWTPVHLPFIMLTDNWKNTAFTVQKKDETKEMM